MKARFKIPLQAEVETYIKEKMKWPDGFCKYYAEKFWNNYQSSGWKLSNGNAVKDWKACFNSQWQRPKFKEDIDMLNKERAGFEKVKQAPLNQVEHLDAFLRNYSGRPSDIAFKDFGQFYEFMRDEKLLRPLTKIEVENLLRIYDGDNGKCRCACVQMTMDGYVNQGFTFGNVFDLRKRLANG